MSVRLQKEPQQRYSKGTSILKRIDEVYTSAAHTRSGGLTVDVDLIEYDSGDDPDRGYRRLRSILTEKQARELHGYLAEHLAWFATLTGDEPNCVQAKKEG